MQSVCAFTMARFTPDVNPKSSALTTRRHARRQFSRMAFVLISVWPVRSPFLARPMDRLG